MPGQAKPLNVVRVEAPTTTYSAAVGVMRAPEDGLKLAAKTFVSPFVSFQTRFVALESNARNEGDGTLGFPLNRSVERTVVYSLPASPGSFAGP